MSETIEHLLSSKGKALLCRHAFTAGGLWLVVMTKIYSSFTHKSAPVYNYN